MGELEWGECLGEEDIWCEIGDSVSCDGLAERSVSYCVLNGNGQPQWDETCNTPLVIAFDGAAVEFAPAGTASFDIVGDGACTTHDWPTESTPWLAIDLDKNGNIESGRELFGSGTMLASGVLVPRPRPSQSSGVADTSRRVRSKGSTSLCFRSKSASTCGVQPPAHRRAGVPEPKDPARGLHSPGMALTPRVLPLMVAAALSCKAQSSLSNLPEDDAPSVGRLVAAQAKPTDEHLPPLEQSCAGNQLDLRWIAADMSRCTSTAEDDTPWPDAVASRLAPSSLTVEAGGTGYVDYVLTNGSANEVRVDIPRLSCFNDLEVDVLDEEGERVQKDCIGGGGCAAPTARITLVAGGEARYRLRVRAVGIEQGWVERSCVLEESPLPLGEYVLEPRMTFADAPGPARTRLVVTAGAEAGRAICEDAAGCIEAGLHAQTGLGTPRDDDRARTAYGRACNLGEGLGCSMLADLQTGEDAERSYGRAARAFGFACVVGEPGDCYQLGFLHEEGKGVAQDHAAAERAHRRAYEGYFGRCRHGGLDGCDMAGKVANGGIMRDEALAKAAYERTIARREELCDGGELETCKDLGIQFRDGKGVDRDRERALRLLLKACEGGLDDDCNLAASLLVTEDIDRAVELYARACKAGNPFACDFEKTYCGRSSRPCPVD